MCGPKVSVLFDCEFELVGLVDLVLSVDSSSLQVVGKGVSVVSSHHSCDCAWAAPLSGSVVLPFSRRQFVVKRLTMGRKLLICCQEL
jgi:hypothetical protein